jgi:hypothetical protein
MILRSISHSIACANPGRRSSRCDSRSGAAPPVMGYRRREAGVRLVEQSLVEADVRLLVKDALVAVTSADERRAESGTYLCSARSGLHASGRSRGAVAPLGRLAGGDCATCLRRAPS